MGLRARRRNARGLVEFVQREYRQRWCHHPAAEMCTVCFHRKLIPPAREALKQWMRAAGCTPEDVFWVWLVNGGFVADVYLRNDEGNRYLDETHRVAKETRRYDAPRPPLWPGWTAHTPWWVAGVDEAGRTLYLVPQDA
jgi:hypothetical protein